MSIKVEHDHEVHSNHESGEERWKKNEIKTMKFPERNLNFK